MAANVTGLHVFQNDTGPEPLSLLDNNYSALQIAINTLNTYSNFYVDTGSPNNVNVVTQPTQYVAYADGLVLWVKIGNTSSTSTPTLNVNSLGPRPIQNGDGSVLATAQLQAGEITPFVYNATRNAWQIAGGAGGGGAGNTFMAPFTVNDSANTAALQVDASGTTTLGPPANPRTVLVVVPSPNYGGVVIEQKANTLSSPPPWSTVIGGVSGSLAGCSFGLQINAGTNANDAALSVNGDGTGTYPSVTPGPQFFRIRGDGSGWLGINASNALVWDANGHFSTIGTASLPGGSTGGASSLSQLSDVSVAGQSNGQVLTWNTASNRWVNASPTGGGGTLTPPVTIYAPATPATTLTVEGAANFPALFAGGSNVAGSSMGFQVMAGFNSADYCVLLQNWAHSATFFNIKGDGSGYLGPNATTTGLNWTPGGAYTFNGATSGTTLTVGTGPTGANTFAVLGPSGSTPVLVRADGTGYIGPNATNCLTWNATGTFTVLGSATLPLAATLTAPFTVNDASASALFKVNTTPVTGGTGIVTVSPGSNTHAGKIMALNGAIDATVLSVAGGGPNTTANYWVAEFHSQSTPVGLENSVLIQGGTNASDTAFKLQNAAGSKTFTNFQGDGSGALGATVTWDPSGNITMTPPLPSGPNQWYVQLGGGTSPTAGWSNGVQVLAGTNSSDAAVSIKNNAATAEMMHIAGDGSGWMGPSSANSLHWSNTGAFTVTGTATLPGGAGTLAGLSDVAIATPTNGQVLTYNSGTSKWANAAPTGGGGLTPPATIDGSGLTTAVNALTVNSPNNAGGHALSIQAPAARGAGLAITPGSNLSDYVVQVGSDATWTHYFFTIKNDGSGLFGPGPNQLSWDTTGAFSFLGTAKLVAPVTIASVASAVALTTNGAAGTFTQIIAGSGAAGQAYGLQIKAGTGSVNDIPLRVQNGAASNTQFMVTGDGAITLPQIGTSGSAANCYLNTSAGNGIFVSTSARRFKSDIRAVRRDRAREIIQGLRAITFRSKCPADDPKRKYYGLVAEDVAAIEPDLVTYDDKGAPSGVQYERVLLLLLPLMQQLLEEMN